MCVCVCVWFFFIKELSCGIDGYLLDPHDSSCRTYHSCANYNPHIPYKCEEYKVYDPERHECIPQSNSTCFVGPTRSPGE